MMEIWMQLWTDAADLEYFKHRTMHTFRNKYAFVYLDFYMFKSEIYLQERFSWENTKI